MIYCAATASLCALEVLAHAAGLPRNMILIAIEIPDSLVIHKVSTSSLPSDWRHSVARRSTRDLGTKWARGRGTAVLSVPSALVPEERNYLINPKHPDFSRIKFRAPKPFVFDPRLKH